MVLSSEQSEALQEAAWAAFEMRRMCPYPPHLMVAEWALASQWGRHQPGHNPFHIAHKEFDDLKAAFVWHAISQVSNPLFYQSFLDFFENRIDMDELTRQVFETPFVTRRLLSIMHMPAVKEAFRHVIESS